MSDASLTFDEGDLNGFVDGRLEASRAAALSESLATDRDARARVDGWKRQNDSLRTMFASVLFEPVPIRLLPTSMAMPKSGVQARVAVAPSNREPKALHGPVRRSGLVATTVMGVALVAFAAGALVSFGTDDFGLSPRAGQAVAADEAADTPTQDRAFTSRALEAHQAFLTDATRPVEITAADEPRLARWIQHGLAGPLQIPSLQRQGWSLIGGRVVPGQHGPAAFLVYGNGADRMGLFIARTPGLHGGDAKVVAGGIEAPSIAYWSEGPFSYALTTSRTSDWLDRNAEALRDTISGQSRELAAAP